MAVEVQMNGTKKGLPDLILLILSYEHPLRIKDVNNRLKRNFRVNISFQAVRKALNAMVEQGKLREDRNQYEIDKEWIKQQKKFSDGLVKNYFVGEKKEKPPTRNQINTKMQVYDFENSLQTDKFLGELLLEIASGKKKTELCIQSVYYWYYLGHLGTESNFLQEMTKRGSTLYYVSSAKKNLLNKLAAKYYQQHGCNFKTIDAELEEDTELIAIDEFVIRVQYPEAFVEEMSKIFSQTNKMEEFDFLEFGKLIKSERKITLTVFKDKSMAKSIIEKTKSYF